MLVPFKSCKPSFLVNGFAATLIGTTSSALAALTQSAPATNLAPASDPPAVSVATPTLPLAAADYGRIALHFERNLGQSGAGVQYLARGAGYALYLEPDSMILGLHRSGSKAIGGPAASAPKKAGTRFVQAQLVAANARAAAEPEGPLAGYSNYLTGSDPHRWHVHVPQFEQVRYRNVYPRIDLVYYGNQHQLEYDFVVAPGGDPRSIRLRYAGIDNARVDETGDLHLEVAGADLIEHKPAIYQDKAGSHLPVDGRFSINKDRSGALEVAFAVADYDRSLPLVIDPILSYATFLGGSGSDTAGGIAVDASGSAYIVGSTVAVDYPTTAGTLQAANAGQSDVFVTRLAADGRSLAYSTYLGGSLDDQGNAIAVDSSGAAYVAGTTGSSDFPVTAGAFQPSLSGSGTTDAFVAKLSADGSTLEYASYLGGSDNETANGIAVDSRGAAYVIGQTYSADFPWVQGAIAKSLLGTWDSFVSKISADGSTLLHSTYLGGVNDNPASIAVDATGAAYVTGTATNSFPVTAGAFQATNAGPHDLFVSKISADGSGYVYSTFLGGSANDVACGIAVDGSGSAYVTGATVSDDFPVTPSALLTHNRARVSGSFVSKLTADGSALSYSTYLDGTEQDTTTAIAVDRRGRAYVTGSTQSTDFPVTPGAPKGTLVNGDTDGFVSVLNATGAALVYSTYMGGTSSDGGTAIAVDAAGNAYVAGETTSADFPTTEGAFRTSFNGSAQEVFAFRFVPLTANPSALDFGDVNAGSASAAQVLSFSNDGFNPLTLSSITTATEQFRRTTTCTTSLASGDSCSISVRFVPSQVGAATDTLTIATSDGPALVKLSGIGAGKGAVLSPDALVFADQLVGTVSPTQFVTITNPGTVAVSIRGISISGSFSQTNACLIIAPQSSCPVNVRFTPASNGAASGALTIDTDAYQNPAPVSLSGKGVSPAVSLSASSLGFGNHAVGTTSGTKTIHLTNTGTTALAISSIQTAAPFAQTNTCGTSVSAGAQCNINVSFSPLKVGAFNGSVTINSNAASSPDIVSLTGAGTGPQASLSPSTLSFGNQPIKTTSAAKTITLSNVGTATLTVNSIQASAGYVETSSCASLAAGKSCTIDVSFAPTSSGVIKGTLTIATNAYGSPSTVKLNGTGITVPAVTLSTGSLDFGNLAVGTTSEIKAINLTNSGTGSLSLASIVTQAPFAQTNTCTSTLAAGATCKISVTYSPVIIGPQAGTLTISSNAASSPDSASLSGTGTGPWASLQPSAIAFGSQRVNTTSSARTVTLTNTGTSNLTLSGISISSGFHQSNSCATLAAGKSCTIKVTFKPTTTGAATGTLTVKTNAYDTPAKVSLSGTGT